MIKLLESLICTICHDYMHVPVMTTCGHNYCYSCISHWLVSNNATELTCPQCRVSIKEPPALNSALQQLCGTIADEIQDENSTIVTTRIECIAQYKKDVSTGNMFHNVFGNTAIAVVDDDDGVARCSNCHWEVEGDVCPHCNSRMRNRMAIGDDQGIDSDEYSEDELAELRNGTAGEGTDLARIYDLEASSEDGSEGSESSEEAISARRPRAGSDDRDRSDVSERESVDSDLNSFIVDEDDAEGGDLSDAVSLPENDGHKLHGASSDDRESYDSDFYEHNDEGGFVSGDSLDDGTASESEIPQEDDANAAPLARKRRFHVVIDSDEDD